MKHVTNCCKQDVTSLWMVIEMMLFGHVESWTIKWHFAAVHQCKIEPSQHVCIPTTANSTILSCWNSPDVQQYIDMTNLPLRVTQLFVWPWNSTLRHYVHPLKLAQSLPWLDWSSQSTHSSYIGCRAHWNHLWHFCQMIIWPSCWENFFHFHACPWGITIPHFAVCSLSLGVPPPQKV